MKSLIFLPTNFQSGKFFFILSIFLLLSLQNYAQGDLLIYPKRLSFEGTQNRVQIVNLNNKGKDSTTYKISFIENRMNEDGKFEIIETPDPGQLFASPYLRFYPRNITLAPNETQVIKVQLVKTGELEPGEYRSHLYFQPVLKPKALDKNEPASNSEGISLLIEPVYGISIASIIRIGEPKAEVNLTNLAFEKFNGEIPIISLDFQRKGNASVYGDIKVYHISANGKKTSVGDSKGFAVYTPGNLRKARLKLREIDEVNYEQGKLVVTYTSQGPKKDVYAEAVLQL
ncbi:MAG TPA: hypothetical protein VLO29_10585 [Salegentibacter sp.]|nr:hypothetical protein [Salegentibacter sp.]